MTWTTTTQKWTREPDDNMFCNNEKAASINLSLQYVLPVFYHYHNYSCI